MRLTNIINKVLVRNPKRQARLEVIAKKSPNVALAVLEAHNFADKELKKAGNSRGASSSRLSL